MQQKLHPEKQSTKTKERPWTMSTSAKSFVPQCSVQEFQPSHNTTKTQTHDNLTIGTKSQHNHSNKGKQREPHQRVRIGDSESFWTSF